MNTKFLTEGDILKKHYSRFGQKTMGGLLAGGLLLLPFSKAAHATPSVNIFYPSTDVLQPNQKRVSSDLRSRDMKTTTYGSGGLGYGFGSKKRAFGRTEIGMDYVAAAPYSNVNLANRICLNGKMQLFSDRANKTTLVAGIWGLGNRGTVGSNSALPPDVAYLLASRRFKGTTLQAGLARSLAKRIIVATPAGNADKNYLQLGFKQAISRRINIGVDYYSGKSAISALAPGIILNLNDHASFHVGYLRYNDSSVQPSQNQVYVLIDYIFGGAEGE
jgi:hypothetical protein